MLIIFEGDTAARDTFRFFEEKLNAGLWSWNVEADHMEWSVNLFRLLGFEPNSLQPTFTMFANMVLPEDRKLAVDLETLARRGLEFSGSLRFMRRDGRVRTFDVHCEGRTSLSTNELLAIGVISDATARAAAAELASNLDSRLGALMDATSGTVWVVRVDGWTLERKSFASTGPMLADLGLGYAWQDVVHPDDIEMVKRCIVEAARDNRRFECEHRTRQPDGSYRWFRSRGVPLRTADGEVREFAGLTTDIQAERVLPESPFAGKDILTGAQIRAARGLINWSVQELSSASGVSPSTSDDSN